jgi:chorismate mutase
MQSSGCISFMGTKQPSTAPLPLFMCIFSCIIVVANSIVLRNVLGWHQTAMLNFEEKVVTGQLPLCIRVLITLQTDQEKKSLRHAYLKGASVLRPDWTPEQEDSRQ